MILGAIELGKARAVLSYPQIIKPKLRDKALEITELFVPDAYRGMGHAKRLLEAIIDYADDNELLLIISADNQKLAGFYQRLGFVTIQTKNVILLARQPQKPICREALEVNNAGKDSKDSEQRRANGC